MRRSDDPVVRALSAITDPRRSGVLVVGECGTGKTFVLREVHASLSGVPGRPEAGTLVRPPRVDEPTFATLLRSVEKASVPSGAAGPPPAHGRRSTVRLVAVDDIDRLSRGAISSLEEALDRGAVQLAGAVRAEHAARVLDLLRPAQPLGIVELGPWQAGELTAFCASRLGDRAVHEQSVRRLLAFSEGNALALTELVERGLEDGSLRSDHGVWVWDGPLHAPPVTRARLSKELGRLDKGTCDVLAATALVEDLEVDQLAAAFGERAVERAESTGILLVRQSGPRLAASVRPAYADVLRGRLASVRRRRLARGLAVAAACAVGPGSRDPVRAVVLSQLSGTPVDTAMLVPAARAALRRHDAALAEAVLADQTADADAIGLRASALVELGRYGEAARVLEDSASGVADEALRERLLARRAALIAVTSGRGPGEPEQSTGRLPAGDYRRLVDAWEGEDLGALLPDPAVGGRDLTDGRAVLAVAGALAQLGRLEDARGLLDRFDADDSSPAEPSIHLAARTLLGLCHLARGAVQEAATVGAELRAVGLADTWPMAYHLGALVSGKCALDRAAVPDAVARLGEASVAQAGVDPVLRRYALTLLSLALAMAGRHIEADTVLREATRLGRDIAPRALTDLARVVGAESMHVRGLHGAALDAATAVVTSSEQHGHRLVHLLALHLCARIRPSPQLAGRVSTAAVGTDFDLADLYVRHAQAAGAQDGRALGGVALEYDHRGLHWLAAETAAACLRAGGGSGSAAWAGDSRRILDRVDRAGQLTRPGWWLQQRPAFSPLTHREREVAELAAEGRTSPQIAALLHVSPRTVENHLQHCYRKLGVAHREQLAGALARGGAAP